MSTKKTIAVIEYGLGNLFSITKALRLFTDTVVVTDDPETLDSVDAIVIPGVGAFAAGMEGLASRGLIDPLKRAAERGVPMLGICLGAQLLMETGFEFGEHQGLGIIPGSVQPFSALRGEQVKVPHIGWNTLIRPEGISWEQTLLEGLQEQEMVYFVHSYVMCPADPAHAWGMSQYGGHPFCAVTKRGNVYGTQFHPEKSGQAGLKLIHNFSRMVP